MKILMISEFYPPFIEGSGRHASLLGRELTKRGHEVIECTLWHKHLNRVEEQNGVKVIRFEGIFQKTPFLFKNPKMRFHPPLRDWLITKKLKKIVERERPDVIHVHCWILYSVIALKKKFDIPIIVTLHDYDFICPKKGLMNENAIVCNEPFTRKCISCGEHVYGPIKSFFIYYGVKLNRNKLKLVDKFIAVSSFVKEVYSKHLSLSDKDIVMIPNFYDIRKMKNSRKLKGAVNFPDDFILFVGNFAPNKGVRVLIDAYKRLNTETELVLIGARRPPYHYKDEEEITIIGDAPHEIVMEAFSKCRFAVIPSIGLEACPTVALEAMSCKKAIIASGVGGLKDMVIDGDTGFLVPPNDSEKLAKAIDQLLQDQILQNKMGEEGFKHFLENYASNRVVPKIENVYANLIQQ